VPVVIGSRVRYYHSTNEREERTLGWVRVGTHLLALEDVDELELLLEGREQFQLSQVKVGTREHE